MANMALNIEQRLGQKLSNVEQIIWINIINLFGENIVIRPYYYRGTIIGSDINTYAVGKMFFILEMSVGGQSGAIQPGYLQFYNEANALSLYLSNSAPYWDATAAGVRNYSQSIVANHILFSRVDNTGGVYTMGHFIGYRITY